MAGQLRLAVRLALSALLLGAASASLQGLQFDLGSASAWPPNVLVLTSYAGPDECWGYETGDGQLQENLQGLAMLQPSVQGDITTLATPPLRITGIRQTVALAGLTDGSTFSGACDNYDTLHTNVYDVEGSKCTFVATANPESGTVGLNFTRTNGTQPYTCSLQYEVVSPSGAAAFMGVKPVPRYVTALRNLTSQADCPAVITKCLGEPGWQMNITSRAVSFVMLSYEYSSSKCGMYGSGYFHENGYIGWEPIYADGPAISFGGSTGFNTTAVTGANQLNVTFWDNAGDSTLGLPPYNCTVIFEVDAAFYQQFTGQTVTATPATPAPTPSPPPQTCTCPCECSSPGAKPSTA